MSNLAIKRIKVDMKLYHKSKLIEQGIYCNFTDDNIYNVKVMIVGPKDTPYQGGFYLFDLTYPKNYPINPPSVKFISMSRKVRIHPNLYSSGKVCLSFLGTWTGPPWTSCLNLNTILLSIISLFNENPIKNEPGFENENGDLSKLYTSMIDYHNITHYTLKILDNTPYEFRCFKPELNNLFIKHYENYCNQLEKHKNITYYKRNIYGLDATVDYKMTKNTLELIKSICLNEIINSNSDQEIEQANNEQNVEQPIISKKRNVPNAKAKKTSENNNRIYKVITTKNGYKRWVLKK